jgi:YggT family protein
MTNPLVLPLRRILPPIGKVDTASIVALLIVQLAATATLWLLGAFPGVFTPLQFLQVAALDLVLFVLRFYFFVLLLYVVLTWVAPGAYSPGAALISSLCEPLLRPVRRVIPPLGGMDLSALFVMIALQALVILIT